jgi:hypothetical protein
VSATVFDPSKLPWLMPVRRAVQVSGIACTELYERLAKGDIVARKMRRSTLVETQSLLDWINKLPRY